MNKEARTARLKDINEKHGWIFKPSPTDGEEYFIAFIGGKMSTAYAVQGAANGWSNMDTWEDFDNDVVAYRPMFKPLFRIK